MWKAFWLGLCGALLCANVAHAACTTYPNPLSTGTTADGSQVIANLTYMSGCLAPLGGPQFTGNVGIGRAPAVYPLEIQGTNGLGLYYTDGTISGGLFAYNGLFEVNTISNNPLGFFVNNTEVARFDTSGNFGINTNNPSYQLTVNGVIWNNGNDYLSTGNYTSANPTITVGDTQYGLSALGGQLYLWTAGSGGFYFDVGGTVQASIASNGLYTQLSDIRLKKEIKPLRGLDMITKLRGVHFVWRKTNHPDIGVIAQDVAKVAPELVQTDPTGLKSVAYSNLVAPLIEAVKELKQANDDERREIRRLKLANQLYEQRFRQQDRRIDALKRDRLVTIAGRSGPNDFLKRD